MTDQRRISASRVARCLVFLALSFFISWLAETGQLGRIVHPRMHPWIVVSGLFFLVLAIAQLPRLTDRPRRPEGPGFFVPFFFVLAIAWLYLQGGAAPRGPLDTVGDSQALKGSILASRDKAASEAATAPLPPTLVFDDERYWPYYNRLYDDPEAAAGRAVVIQGFIYRQGNLPAGTAIVGRNLMWCCSADMAVIGLIVQDGAMGRLPESTWVEVSGRLGATEFDMKGDGNRVPVPLIMADSVRAVNKGSTSGIIFPY
jgi:putative membrane protein